MQLDQQYWKFKEVYPWTFGINQSEEISNSAQHFAERYKKVPLQDTVLSLINAPPLINAPLTYFQIKLGNMPIFLYGVSL